MITIETKIHDFLPQIILEDLGRLFGKISRRYFVDHHIKKIPLNDLKKSYQRQYKISSRHFNSIRSEVDGKVRAYEEILTLNIDEKLSQISTTQKSIKKLDKEIKSAGSDIKKILTHKKKLEAWKSANKKSKRPKLSKDLKEKNINALNPVIEEKRFKRHQKMRRLGILQDKLAELEKKQAPSLCFGSKNLFLKQFHLEESGYFSLHEWKEEWHFQRNSQSFFIGAHCESARNLNAQYNPLKKTLKVRLPECLEQKYKSTHCLIENLEFSYGQEWLNDAILNPISEKNGKKQYSPVSYRFIERKSKEESAFYCQAIFEPKSPEKKSDARLGAIGLDLNADHIAMMETDRFGNPIFAQSYPFSMEASSDQIEAVFGDHIATIVEHAEKTGKIIVCEDLDFKKKKQALRETVSSKRLRKILSSFAYQKFFSILNSRCDKKGVKLKKVNPAFTSIIGFYKFSGYGIYTSHECAALSIARRGLGLSERAKSKVTPIQTESIEEPLMKVPEYSIENSDGHVWKFYSRNTKCIREILFQSSQSGRKRTMFYNPRHPSSYTAGLRCDKTLLRCLSP